MSDMDRYREPGSVSKAAVKGFGALAGGLAIMAARALAGAFWGIPGLVIGGAAIILGATSMKSEAKADKIGGTVALAAGAALALPGLANVLSFIPVIGGLTGVLAGITSFALGAGTIGLIGYGAYNVWQFFKGLKSRA